MYYIKLEMRFRRADIKFLSSSTCRKVAGGYILPGESFAMKSGNVKLRWRKKENNPE
jgi:hypothetical protein